MFIDLDNIIIDSKYIVKIQLVYTGIEIYLNNNEKLNWFGNEDETKKKYSYIKDILLKGE